MNNPDIDVDEQVLRTYSNAVSTIKLKIGKESQNNNVIIQDIISQMQKLKYAQYEICDMLVKDMFKEHRVFKNDRRKELFFNIYGDIIYDNILANKPKYGYVCVDCGAPLEHNKGGRCRCDKCQKIYRRQYKTTKDREYRNSCGQV
jgi:DNA-directed RNA polymerase subunit RPC12/RpoP